MSSTELVGATAAAGALAVRVISDYASFLALEPVWNALVEEARIDHPFLRHEWVRTWWECFGNGNALHILVVMAGGLPVAIAPMMLSRGRMYGLPVRQLGFPHNAHTPRFDLIVARPGEQVYRAIWDAIVAQRRLWDVLVLRQLPAGSPTVEALMRLAGQDGFRVGLWESEASPYVPFDGGWENYVKGRSRNHRSKIRKGFNRLTRTGPVRLEIITDGAQMAGALEDGLRIEAAAWKAQAGTAVRSRPEVHRFYQAFAERAARLGVLRLLFLTVEGVRIAFAYGLCYQNKLYVLKAGYDPDYARYSPYNLLCYLVFRDGFERGLAEYEFLGGSEAWKLDWTRQARTHVWLFVFPPGARARLLHLTKFRVIPALQRQRLYALVHRAIVDRRRRAVRAAVAHPAAEPGEDGES